MFISDLIAVVGYLHMAGFKNRQGTFCQVYKHNMELIQIPTHPV